MPKGMRIPVSLNASGLPIGKEAATLSSFLGTLARDGILAPLSHLGWKSVPEKNKDVMRHIVKVCTNTISVFSVRFLFSYTICLLL